MSFLVLICPYCQARFFEWPCSGCHPLRKLDLKFGVSPFFSNEALQLGRHFGTKPKFLDTTGVARRIGLVKIEESAP
jgi:hypothetical protein